MANPHPNASSLDTTISPPWVVQIDFPVKFAHTILKPGQRMPRVSSMGRFRSSRGVITRPKPQKDGYVPVGIFKFCYRMHALESPFRCSSSFALVWAALLFEKISFVLTSSLFSMTKVILLFSARDDESFKGKGKRGEILY